MKKTSLRIVLVLCVCSFLFSAAALAADDIVLYKLENVFNTFSASAVTTVYENSNHNLKTNTEVGAAQYQYPNLGINWNWKGVYANGADVRFQVQGLLGIWSAKTNSATCSSNLGAVYCIRWVGANNNNSQILRAKFTPEYLPTPGPDPAGNYVDVSLSGFTSLLSEQ